MFFLRKAEGKPFIGKVWPGFTAWPDFLNPLTADYWHDMIKDFIEGVPVDGTPFLQFLFYFCSHPFFLIFEPIGLWVDMNEIDSFCNGDCPRGSEKSKKNTIISIKRKLNNNWKISWQEIHSGCGSSGERGTPVL